MKDIFLGTAIGVLFALAAFGFFRDRSKSKDFSELVVRVNDLDTKLGQVITYLNEEIKQKREKENEAKAPNSITDNPK